VGGLCQLSRAAEASSWLTLAAGISMWHARRAACVCRHCGFADSALQPLRGVASAGCVGLHR